ncbi:hypothetical protein FCJ61_19945 [Burkholderia metallica]|nr:hypothetical protein [Burkholderia metallica]
MSPMRGRARRAARSSLTGDRRRGERPARSRTGPFTNLSGKRFSKDRASAGAVSVGDFDESSQISHGKRDDCFAEWH